MFSIALYAYDVKLCKVSFFRAFGILCGYVFFANCLAYFFINLNMYTISMSTLCDMCDDQSNL
jgi:hypothetical protein